MDDRPPGTTDPFQRGEALALLVKQLERRWGLSVVSMLPQGAQEFCTGLQRRIDGLLSGTRPRADQPPSRTNVDFYEANQLHTTHFTLVRSTAAGPIRVADFVKPSDRLERLHEILGELAANLTPLRVAFTELRMSSDGLGVILAGHCVDEASLEGRRVLLEELNRRLPQHFNIEPRSWDKEPTRYPSIHTTIGYLKRPVDAGYEATTDAIVAAWSGPHEFVLHDLTVVHHRYRSLIPPHEGQATFAMGSEHHDPPEAFVRGLGLVTDGESG